MTSREFYKKHFTHCIRRDNRIFFLCEELYRHYNAGCPLGIENPDVLEIIKDFGKVKLVK